MRCEVVENGMRCLNPVLARGMCEKHYVRERKYGDPLEVHVRGAEVPRHSFEEIERVTAQVRREARWLTMQILVGMANDAART